MRCHLARMLFMAAALTPVGGFAGPGDPSAASNPEYRRAVPASAEAAARLRLEMRQYLIGIKKVLDAAVASDMKRVAEAAREMGRAAEYPMPDAFHAALPGPFLSLALATQEGIATMADQAERGGDGPSALRQLSRITSQCISCHVTYRLEVEDEAIQDETDERDQAPPKSRVNLST